MRQISMLTIGIVSACPPSADTDDAGVETDETSVETDETDPPPVDRTFTLGTSVGTPIPAVHGHYELSGALHALDQVPGLVDTMTELGPFSWRIGLGRWEVSTYALDEGDCASLPDEFVLPDGWTLEDVLEDRDWFELNVDVGTEGVVDAADLEVIDNYDFAYFDAVLATADAFGAAPYISIDYVPRALSSESTTNVVDCRFTFANGVSNAPPADPELFALAVLHVARHYLEGWGGGTPRDDLVYWEIWNEPELPQNPAGRGFWTGTQADWLEMYAYIAAAFAVWRDDQATTYPVWNDVRVGGGSFWGTEWFVPFFGNALGTDAPIEFLSAHHYTDSAAEHVAYLQALDDTRDTFESTYPDAFTGLEVFYAEWGPDLGHAGDAAFHSSNAAATLHAAVLTAAVEEEIAATHRAMFYDLYGQVAIGIVNGDGELTPSGAVYAYFNQLVGQDRLDVAAYVWDAEELRYTVLAGTDGGAVSVLVAHVGGSAERVQLVLDGERDWSTWSLSDDGQVVQGPSGTGDRATFDLAADAFAFIRAE